MKKIILIAIVLLTLPAMSQEHRKEGKKPHGKEAMLKDYSPEEIATLKTKKMTLHLDLTVSQQKRVKALLLEEAEFHKKQREEREAKKTENADREKPNKEERYALMNARLDRQIAMKQKMKDILNDEQYQKWEKTLSKRNREQLKKRKDGFHKKDR